MLRIYLKELNSEYAIYLYYPEGDKNIKPGLVKIKIDNLEIVEYEKSGVEEEGDDYYLIHAFSRIRSNTKRNYFPENNLVAWG